MKTRARIATWQRLRQQPTWKLMDEATLLAHRALWVTEPQPHRADVIDHLDAVEQALYRDLRGDRWGVRVRLEQERIGWDVAWARIRPTLSA